MPDENLGQNFTQQESYTIDSAEQIAFDTLRRDFTENTKE
jgi:hypothetical protein